MVARKDNDLRRIDGWRERLLNRRHSIGNFFQSAEAAWRLRQRQLPRLGFRDPLSVDSPNRRQSRQDVINRHGISWSTERIAPTSRSLSARVRTATRMNRPSAMPSNDRQSRTTM